MTVKLNRVLGAAVAWSAERTLSLTRFIGVAVSRDPSPALKVNRVVLTYIAKMLTVGPGLLIPDKPSFNLRTWTLMMSIKPNDWAGRLATEFRVLGKSGGFVSIGNLNDVVQIKVLLSKSHYAYYEATGLDLTTPKHLAIRMSGDGGIDVWLEGATLTRTQYRWVGRVPSMWFRFISGWAGAGYSISAYLRELELHDKALSNNQIARTLLSYSNKYPT